MSNVIKSYTVRYEDAIKTIDNHLKKDAEILTKRSQMINHFQQVSGDGFVAGLQAIVVEPEVEEPTENAEEILEHANKKAAEIVARAKEEAERIKSDTYALSQKQGYEDGLKKAQMDLQQKHNELEAEKVRLYREQEAMRKQLEPGMADVMADLIEKITGVIVENQKNVILYLIEKAFLGLDKADEIIIRVSPDDFALVDSQKDSLRNSIGREVSLLVIEDGNLVKNQCKLETENKILDCSLDVQLANLVTDIKLLSRI